jgi:hypothetical protein
VRLGIYLILCFWLGEVRYIPDPLFLVRFGEVRYLPDRLFLYTL